MELEGLPQAIKALAEKFPACSCGDYTGCHGQRTEAMMEKITDLTETHPVYSTDDGEEQLWADLANVAISALRERDNVLDAIDYFLGAAYEEVPKEAFLN